jgi:methylornithine synthase
MQTKELDLHRLLLQLQDGYRIQKSEIKYLLDLRESTRIELLFKAARKVRTDQFGDKIFLYGFLYFSTYCKNNCRFCQYRQSNKMLPRYRKSEDEILTAAAELADAGVHLIDLTMGEDPEFYSPKSDSPDSFGGSGFLPLSAMIKKVQQKTALPVMISPGPLPDEILKEMANSGVSWYACYQETHNQELYRNLRTGQSFKERLRKKLTAKQNGMLIEEGIMTGIGESTDDLADSILWMRDAHVDQARVMTFVPQHGTPMVESKAQGELQELITIAVMRLVLPDRLIPASLDINGLDGLKARLDAGANVVTSIVPPEKGLAGVANHSLDIEDSRRSLDHILPILAQCGLSAASQQEYSDWIRKRQNSLTKIHNRILRMVC